MKIGNLEVYGVIYKITNKVNGKTYIGQTTRGFEARYHGKGKDAERVYNYMLSRKKSGEKCNEYLFKALEKYKVKNFEVNKVLDIAFSKEELDIKEKTYIKFYKSDNRSNGYNFAEGGANGKFSEDSKVKNGVIVVCLNDGKEFKSIREASIFYNVTEAYVRNTFPRRFHSDYRNYKFLRFKKRKKYLEEDEKLCACCGNVFKLKGVYKSKRKDAKKVYNKSAKFCEKCKNEKYRKRKDVGKSSDFGIKKLYLYEDVKSKK